MPNGVLGASKLETTRFAHSLIGMMDSLHQTDDLIRVVSEREASATEGGIDLGFTLEELLSMKNRLTARIEKANRILMGRDSATARAIEAATKDDVKIKKMKARAIRLKIRHKIKDVLMSAVPYKRRISRTKKGMWS